MYDFILKSESGVLYSQSECPFTFGFTFKVSPIVISCTGEQLYHPYVHCPLFPTPRDPILTVEEV